MSISILPTTFEEMAAAMLTCEQTQGQSVYQHGVSVRQHFFELIDSLENNHSLDEWRIPQWIHTYRDQILANLHDHETISNYTLYHDCGKPYCREVDDEGRVHFPNHAEISRDVWMNVGKDEIVGLLIANDMVIHTATADEINQKLVEEWSIKDSLTLLMAALAEIHSNAKMFGSIESNSFKSKWKKIDRRGKQICKYYFGGDK